MTRTLQEARKREGLTQADLLVSVIDEVGRLDVKKLVSDEFCKTIRRLTQSELSFYETFRHLMPDAMLDMLQAILDEQLAVVTMEDLVYLIKNKRAQLLKLVSQREGRPRWEEPPW